jgi:Zn finger protein HypA/HybF involved in hydrogenase expression
MKKSELKEIIKPIVKECVEESVQEILLESGLLSAVIKEVMKGALPVLTEATNKQAAVHTPAKQKAQQNNELLEQLKRDREEMASEMRKQSNEVNKSLSMKVGGVDVFRGTTPAPATVQESVANPLGGVSPNDPGVDISKIFGRKKFNII